MFCFASRMAAVALALLLAPAIHQANAAEPDAIGGLQRVEDARADIAYRDPRVDFTRYHRILLDDLDMSNVNIVQPQTSFRSSARRAWELTDSDRESLGKAFRETMTRELVKGGYPVVSEAAEDALRISVALTDLAPAAPKDDMRSRGTGRSVVISRGAGEIAIGVIVRDSLSGEVLAIIKDSSSGSRTARLNTSVSNLSEVRRAFAGWARELRLHLDSIHGR